MMPEIENQSSKIWEDGTIGFPIDYIKWKEQSWSWKIRRLLSLEIFHVHYFTKN